MVVCVVVGRRRLLVVPPSHPFLPITKYFSAVGGVSAVVVTCAAIVLVRWGDWLDFGTAPLDFAQCHTLAEQSEPGTGTIFITAESYCLPG